MSKLAYKAKEYLSNWHHLALLLILLAIIICRFVSIAFVPDVFSDEAEILDHIKAIITTGADRDGNRWAFYFKVGVGLATYTYIYPMALFLSIIGVSAFKARVIQQIITIIAVALVAVSMKKITKKSSVFWLTLFVGLTLPWGFVQANRVWDPALVVIYFALYFYFYTKLLVDSLGTKMRYCCSILSAIFLVLLAVVYPPCRIPAVAMWILSVGYAYSEKKIHIKELKAIVVASIITALPLAISLLDDDFNSRATALLVFQDGPRYKEFYQLLKNFFNLFSPSFLFITGDIINRHSLPMFGLIGTISIVPIFVILKNKKNLLSFYMILIIGFTCFSTALTNDYSPHSLRSTLCFMPYTILIALGWDMFLEKKSSKQKYLWYGVMITFFIIYFTGYILYYTGHLDLYP